MNNKKKWMLAACAVLIAAISVAGTVAYLTATTGSVNNTFTVGKLLADGDSFDLKEHKATMNDAGVYSLGETEVDTNSYTVLPGVDIPKDPFVRTKKALLLDAYVFVEVVEDSLGTDLSYTVDADKWTVLTGVTGPNGGKVYSLKANSGIAKKGSALGPVTILKQNAKGKEITVANNEIEDAAAQLGGNLKFYGYMIQAGSFENASAAWNAGFAPKE